MGNRRRLFENGFRLLQRSGLSRAMAPFTQGCGIVFMLHRVCAPRPEGFQPNRHLEICPDFLKTVVARVRDQGYRIVPLGEAVDLLKTGYGDQRYAVLTFDDGYRDNLTVAHPVLKELGAPFTVFVTSGLIDRSTELWWVALERLIAANRSLDLVGTGAGDGIACASDAEKEACFCRLTHWLTHEVSEDEQRAIVRHLCERHGLDLAALADELMMDWDELRRLAGDPLVTIGAHTHGHYALAQLDETAARADMAAGIRRLEQELGRKPRYFAYPYGNDKAAGPREAALASELGFQAAVTTVPGVLKSVHARDLMLLPRVSLNGYFQDAYMVDQYLTGAPFALYRTAKRLQAGLGLRSLACGAFPSTR
ncbi:polysaccharide deacetylase family protein [Polymorphum gilvum]|uniref:Chitooligosaccharide deacetylase n=1 Tax=Polymorphum gilvum (strain LMG 25793 / CGMCC 1.9160 / SL003B-26A1) TaxID=991905 RepID=F2IWN9_POLGS|nr:polysaccharide deacetylase family protein [Polymorphum gilvum]ADZ70364.1 Polysaccharide deacetylase domain protein [Polymorphum gilvum SL003B-26A1]